MIEVAQPMKIMQVPRDRSVLAIDLKRVKRLVATCISRRLKRCQRPVIELGQKSTGVVNLNLLLLTRCAVNPLFDERLGQC